MIHARYRRTAPHSDIALFVRVHPGHLRDMPPASAPLAGSWQGYARSDGSWMRMRRCTRCRVRCRLRCRLRTVCGCSRSCGRYRGAGSRRDWRACDGSGDCSRRCGWRANGRRRRDGRCRGGGRLGRGSGVGWPQQIRQGPLVLLTHWPAGRQARDEQQRGQRRDAQESAYEQSPLPSVFARTVLKRAAPRLLGGGGGSQAHQTERWR